MRRAKINLPVNKWGTLKSKYQPESNYLSNDEFTAGSSNFITNVSGAIEKRPTDAQYNPTALSGPGKDQFEAIFSNGVHHLLLMDNGALKYTSGDNLVHTAATGYTSIGSMEYTMFQNRVYFCNGIDSPGVYDLTASYGSVAYTPPQVKNMGCQAPSSAPTFAADSAGGSVPVGGHTYKVTFLYYGFEESNGSPATTLHTVSAPNQTVNLTSVPVGSYGVTARNIYRDNNDGNYLLIGTISNNTAVVFQDTVSAGTTAIPTTNNVPPVFSYIVLNLSRLWVAGVSGTPTTIYWSTPGLPDIFDPSNSVSCNPKDPIQALAVYQGTVYVLNRHSFGQILGNTDDTFYYQEFPGFVGCVDTRSIQVRTINGVPVLVWLSDRGLYAFNGSSVEYISDPIEDEVNLNIQQVNFVTGSNSQSTQSDFAAGTASPAIDITSDPGTIKTIDPIETYQAQSEWETGQLTNIATRDGSNAIKVPLKTEPTLASGTLSGAAVISSNQIQLPTITDFIGIPFTASVGQLVISTAYTRFAQLFNLSYAGTVNTIQMRVAETGNTSLTVRLEIWSDASNPASILYAGPNTVISPNGDTLISATPNMGLAAGTYYIVVSRVSGSTHWSADYNLSGSFPSNALAYNGSSWISFPGKQLAAGFTFTQTAQASSGTWNSPIYDTACLAVSTGLNLTLAGTYPSGSYSSGPYSTTGVATVQGSNSATFTTIDVTENVTNLNGSQTLSISGVRYWRVVYSVSTTDNRATPVMGAPTLKFNTTSTWISPAINCTTDVTSYNALTVTQNVPAGTSVTITVATSADNITYTPFVPVGSATVQRYVKVKAVLTATTTDDSTPSITLLAFSWNVQATFTSSVINVGQVPSGWGLFQTVYAANGGTIVFYMRSAASAGALTSDPNWISIPGAVVSNGNFPNPSILPLLYTQWRIIFTATPNAVPEVDSVTVNWFLGNNQSPIRVASLFFNRTYYLAAAENNQTVNNVVIAWDQEGNWRLFRGLNINSLGLFFNQPFYLDAVRSYIYSWLIPATGTGTAIEMDVRTKAFDLLDYDHLKNPRSLRVMGLNTGTTIHAYFSVDRGITWIEMLNSHGNTGYVTTADGSKFYEYFVPDYSLNETVTGLTIMFRVTSMDAFPCEILSLEPEITIRSGKYLGYAT